MAAVSMSLSPALRAVGIETFPDLVLLWRGSSESGRTKCMKSARHSLDV